MLRHLLLLSCLLLAGAAEPSGTIPNRAFFGINPSAYADWGTSYPFADLMKQSRPWFRADKAPVELDARGNPSAGSCPVQTILALSDVHLPLGTYVLTWEGIGSVQFSGSTATKGTIVSQADRRIELKVTTDGSLLIEILRSETADPVRNLRCWLPGSEGQASPFNANYLRHLRPCSTIRFMDWMHTNGSHIQTWADRPTPEHQTYRSRKGATGGVPVEVMVDLANELKADPWFCMPHQADDDFVRRFAQVVAQRLDPALRVYIEYSNETWNMAPGFEQSLYCTERGRALGIADKDGPTSFYTARRSVEIWAIWEEVFGGTRRLVRVMSGQASNPLVMQRRFKDPAVVARIDAIAIAPYAGFSADIRTAFDEKIKTPDDAIDALAAQLVPGGKIEGMVTAHAALATQHGKRLVAYEGGLVYSLPTALKNDPAKLALIHAADTSARNEEICDRYLRIWYRNGGGMFALFCDIAPQGKYGCWGTFGEWLDEPDETADKRRAVHRLMRDPGLVPAGARP